MKPWEMHWEDYYQIMDVPFDATQQVTTRAYKYKVNAFHPDKFPLSMREQAEKDFKKLGQAYSVLHDPPQRSLYDSAWQNKNKVTSENQGPVPNAQRTYYKSEDEKRPPTSYHDPSPHPFQTYASMLPKKLKFSLFLKIGTLLFLMTLMWSLCTTSPRREKFQVPQQALTSSNHIPTQPKPESSSPPQSVPAKPKPVERLLYASPESNRAHQIMGKNFLGIDEASQHFKVEMTQESIENLKEIPFSEDVLMSCKDTHILVADLGLSLLDMKDGTEKLFSFPWYKSENFAKVTDQPQWRLLRKNATPNSYNSFNEGWDRQQSTLAQDEKIPTIRQMAYAVILNYLVNRERLLQDAYLKCSDEDSLGYRLSLGNFTEDGLGIFSGWYIFDINKGFGLASARKPQK